MESALVVRQRGTGQRVAGADDVSPKDEQGSEGEQQGGDLSPSRSDKEGIQEECKSARPTNLGLGTGGTEDAEETDVGIKGCVLWPKTTSMSGGIQDGIATRTA